MASVDIGFKISGDYSDLQKVKDILSKMNTSATNLNKKFSGINTSLLGIQRTLDKIGKNTALTKQADNFGKSVPYLQAMVTLLKKSTDMMELMNKKMDRLNLTMKKVNVIQKNIDSLEQRQAQRWEQMKTTMIKVVQEQYRLTHQEQSRHEAVAKVLDVYNKMTIQMQKIRKFMYNITDALTNMYRTLAKIIKVVNTLINLIKSVFNIIMGIFNVVKIMIGSYFRIINQTISFVYNTLKGIQTLLGKTILSAVKTTFNILKASFNLLEKTISSLISFGVNLVKTFLALPKILSDVYRQQAQIGKTFYNFVTLPSRMFNSMQDSIGRITKEQQNVFFRIYTSIWMVKRAFGQTLQDAMGFTKQLRAIEALRIDVGIKNVTDKFNEETETITRQVKKIATETGSDLMDVAKAYYWVVSAGMTKLNDQAEVTKQQAYMAQVAVSPVKDVVMQATQALNAYSLSADKINDVLYSQFELVKKGVLVYQDITSSMGKTYASARNIGIGYERLYELVGFLSKMGLSVDKSTTALNTLFTKLANQATINNFKKLNIELFNTNGQYRDFLDILGDVSDKLSGLDAQSRTWALSMLAIPLRQQKAFLTLITHYKELHSYAMQFESDTESYAKNADKELKAYLNNYNAFFYAMERFKQEWTSFTYTIQDILQAGQSVKFLNYLIDVLRSLEIWIDRNKKAIQDWLVYFTELVTTIGAVWLGLKMIGVFLNPLTGIVMSVVMASQKLKDEFTGIFKMFQDAFLGKGSLQDQIDNFIKELPKFGKTALDIFTDFMKRVGIIVKTTAITLGQEFYGLLFGGGQNKAYWETIQAQMKKYTKPIYEATLIGVKTGTIDKVVNDYATRVGLLMKMSPTGSGIFNFLFGGSENSADTNASNLFSGKFDKMKDSIIDIAKKKIDEIVTKLNDYINTNAPDWVKKPFNSIEKAIDDQIQKYNTILKNVQGGQNNPAERNSKKQNPLAMHFLALIELAKDDIKSLSKNFVDWFSTWIQSNDGLIPGIYNAIFDGIEEYDIGTKAKDAINSIIHKINVALFTTRFGETEQDYSKWIKTNKMSDKDQLVPIILEFLGIGTKEKPVGTKVYSIAKGIKDRMFGVLSDSMSGLADAMKKYSKNQANFTDLISASTEFYGSIFDALTTGFLGINLKTGALLGTTTGKITDQMKNLSSAYKEHLKDTIGDVKIEDILNSKSAPVALKLKALGKVLFSSMFDKDSIVKDITQKIKEIFDSIANSILQFTMQHWKSLSILQAIATGNPIAIGAQIGASGIGLLIDFIRNNNKNVTATTNLGGASSEFLFNLGKLYIQGHHQVGGYTADIQAHKPAGVVHGGEWVAPKWMVDSPKYRSIIAGLEQARKGIAGFGNGGANDGNPLLAMTLNTLTPTANNNLNSLLSATSKQLDKFKKSLDQATTAQQETQKKQQQQKQISSITDQLAQFLTRSISGEGIPISKNNVFDILSSISSTEKSVSLGSVGDILYKKYLPEIEANKQMAEKIKQLAPKLKEALTMSVETSIMQIQKNLPNLYKALQSYKEINDAYKVFVTAALKSNISASDVHQILSQLDLYAKQASEGGIGALYAQYKVSPYTKTQFGQAISDKYIGQYKQAYLIQQLQSGNVNAMGALFTGNSVGAALGLQSDKSWQTIGLAKTFAVELGTTIEKFAKTNQLSISETIQLFADAEKQRQELFINQLSNVTSKTISQLHNLTNSLVKVGLDNNTANSINKTLTGISEGASAFVLGSKVAADIGTGSWQQAIIDGINALQAGISAIGDLFGGIFNNTTALKDNTKAIMDLSNIQNKIYQKTYNGNANITIRLTDGTGQVLQQVNTSSGVDVYDIQLN